MRWRPRWRRPTVKLEGTSVSPDGRQRGRCPICGTRQDLTKAGYLIAHKDGCAGCRMRPAP